MKPIAFYPQLARELGDIESAIFYQQIYFWSDKGSREDGFIYKTCKQIEEETTLTRRQQDRIKDNLVKMGWLEIKLVKVKNAPTLHFKPLVSMDLICTKRTNGIVQKVQNQDLHERDKSSIQRLPESTTGAVGTARVGKFKKQPIPITRAESSDLVARLDEKFGAAPYIDLIGAYLTRRKAVFETKEAFNEAVRRHTKPAKLLVENFSKNEIIRGMDEAERKFEMDWTLETCYKQITK